MIAHHAEMPPLVTPFILVKSSKGLIRLSIVAEEKEVLLETGAAS